MVTDYYQMIIDRGYGLITCGNHLGVMVAPQKDIGGCPPGWGFVATEIATLELIKLTVDHVSKGRDKWPKKQNSSKKQSEDEMLEEVFSSQDYIGS